MINRTIVSHRTQAVAMCLLLLAFSGMDSVFAIAWNMKKATIMTRFAADINPDNVRGEYPRPQMERSAWMNLNGIWQFSSLSAFTDPIPDGDLSGSILVPFPVESAISGVMKHYDNICYKRQFSLPSGWTGKRLLLHFDAVDYQCTVFVNGDSVGTHKGGYDPFTFDITSFVKSGSTQELSVKVTDPTNNGGQPRGKQTLSPSGIMYTATTGIWQPVWLEAVNTTYISSLNIVPNVDNSSVKVSVDVGGNTSDVKSLSISVLDGTKVVTSSTSASTDAKELFISNPKLWSPDHPFLYDLEITLTDSKGNEDHVKSYFGMRKFSLAQEGGYKKLMLNNQFLFQIGPLDQGFWPDGLYTAPTDEAICNDIAMMKKMGFNMVRKHIKVEPMRWYYWCDKLGLLVWQDMPSANSYTSTPATLDTKAYSTELTAMVNHLKNEPCIAMWVIFNESQGQHNTSGLVNMVRGLDPTRLINQASGGSWYGVGDVLDLHNYPAPAYPTSSTQATACGEYGGIKYLVSGHTWNSSSFGYTTVANVAELDSLYNSYASLNAYYKGYHGLSAAVYTQLTDVETELNGLMTYDRVVKPVIGSIYKSNRMMVEKTEKIITLLPTADEEKQTWRYTTTQPSSDWYQPSFDASAWKEGLAGFGANGQSNMVYGTSWTSSNIWIRKTVSLNISQDDLKRLYMKLYHDEDCEVYINGVLAISLTGYTTDYNMEKISSAALAAIQTQGDNVIAIHCKQTNGGQFIDLGLVDIGTDRSTETLRTLNLNMDYSHSSEISISAGISADTSAIVPAKTQLFTHFNYADDALNTAAFHSGLNDDLLTKPTQLSFDLTQLSSEMDYTQPLKYFFSITTSADASGQGHLYNADVHDFFYDAEGTATPFRLDTILISGSSKTYVFSVIVGGESTSSPRHLTISNNTYQLSWQAPVPCASQLTGYLIYANGALLDSVSASTLSYKVQNVSATQYAVAAVYKNAGKILISEKSNTARLSPDFVHASVAPMYVIKGNPTYVHMPLLNATKCTWELYNSNHRTIIDGYYSSCIMPHPGYYDATVTLTSSDGSQSQTFPKALAVSNAESFKGLYFAGQGEKVTFTSPITEAQAQFSIDWWMKPDRLSGSLTMSSGDGVMFATTDTTGVMSFSLGTRTVRSSADYVIANEWHHYALVFRTGKITFYRDGEKISAPSTVLALKCPAITGGFTLGGSDAPFKGTIDEFRFWNKAISAVTLAKYSNEPIDRVDSLQTNEGLAIYCNFNQTTGDVTDLTTNKNNGIRTGFGNDTQAWVPTRGVFTLDDAAEQDGDVTATYLTNYKAPFYYTSQLVNGTVPSRFYQLETGTARSTWILRGTSVSDTIETGAYVDRDYSYNLTATTGFSNFSPMLTDHTLYQTISLPAGIYRFSIASQSDFDACRSYLVVTEGTALADNAGLASTLAATRLADQSLEFRLYDDAVVSLGVLYNMWDCASVSISQFNLVREACSLYKADEKVVGISETTSDNISHRIQPQTGGLRILNGAPLPLTVYDTAGRVIYRNAAIQSGFIALPKGIYIAGGQTFAITK